MRPAFSLALVPLVTLAVQSAAQQPDTTRLPTTVVTATRVPVSTLAAPASVAVVTGEELRVRGITSVADALRTLPGVALAQNGSFGALTSLFLRGGESKYVKVLIDGIAVNDPGGAYDFGTLTTDNVERIEVVRGPASVLYGADAVTGVVQIFTRRGAGPTRAAVSARGGTYGSSDVDAAVSGGLSAGDYSVSVARHGTRGIYDFNNGYQNNVVSGRVRASLDSLTELRATVRYTDYIFHYPTNGAGAVTDSNAKRAEDKTALGIEVVRHVTPRTEVAVSLAANGTAGGTDDRQDTPQSGGTESQDRVRRRAVDVRANYEFAPQSFLSVGAQLEQQDQRSETQSVFGTTFNSTSVFTASRRNEALYTQVLANLPYTATFTAGARLDDNERFGQFGTYRAGASWAPLVDTRLRASIGTAFREPSFFENYATGFVTGNRNLEPERAVTWEVGVKQNLLDSRVSLGATWFAQRFRNMIDYTGATTACGASYCNVARAKANGVELEGRASLTNELSVDGNATFLDARVLTPGFDTTAGGLYRAGQRLIRRPRRTFNVGAVYQYARAKADLHLTRVGERDDRDFAPFPARPVVDPAYTRADIGAEFVIAPRAQGRPETSITLRAENLFDATYESVFNFRSPRRTILAGARLVF